MHRRQVQRHNAVARVGVAQQERQWHGIGPLHHGEARLLRVRLPVERERRGRVGGCGVGGMEGGCFVSGA